jgi:TRAP-type uncharacterized transport system substrate-binding protein
MLGFFLAIVVRGMAEETVYRITKETVESLKAWRKSNPTTSKMTVKAMLEEMPAPVHPGAMTYSQASGLRPTVRPEQEGWFYRKGGER